MSTCLRCERALPTEELLGVAEGLICIPCFEAGVKAEARRDSIDAAWLAVEATLPKGIKLSGLTCYEGTWGAFTDGPPGTSDVSFGDSPAAALRALARYLAGGG